MAIFYIGTIDWKIRQNQIDSSPHARLTQEGTQQDQHGNHITKPVDYDEDEDKDKDEEEPEKELQFEKLVNPDKEVPAAEKQTSRTIENPEEETDGEEQGDDSEKDDQEIDNDDPMTGGQVARGIDVEEEGQDNTSIGGSKASKRKGRWEGGSIRGPKVPKMKHIKDARTKTRMIKSEKSRKKQQKALPIASGGARFLESDVQNDVQAWPGPLPTQMDADSKEWYFIEPKITLDVNDTPPKIEETQEWRMADATGNWHTYKPTLHVSISLALSTFPVEYLYSASK